MVRRALVSATVIGCIVGCVVSSTALADKGKISSLDTIYMEVGMVSARDFVSFGDGSDMALSGSGLRYYERHCCLARFLAAMTVGLVGGVASGYNVKDTKVEERQLGGGVIERKTTTTYYTEEEMEANRQAVVDATTGIMTLPLTMELIYLPQQDNGDLHGFQWTWYLAEYPRGKSYRVETGVHWDRLSGPVANPATGTPAEFSYRNVGFPIRLVWRPREWAQLDLEMRVSVLFHDGMPENHNRDQMARGSLTVQLPWRLRLVDMIYGRVSAQSNDLAAGGTVGHAFEIGVRL